MHLAAFKPQTVGRKPTPTPMPRNLPQMKLITTKFNPRCHEETQVKKGSNCHSVAAVEVTCTVPSTVHITLSELTFYHFNASIHPSLPTSSSSFSSFFPSSPPLSPPPSSSPSPFLLLLLLLFLFSFFFSSFFFSSSSSS